MRHAMLVILCALGLVACGPSAGGNPEQPKSGERKCPGDAPPRRAGAAPSLLVQDGHSAIVNWMALNGDGRVLATASMDGTLRLWDTQSGLLLRKIATPGATNGVALDNSGGVIAHAVSKKGAKPHAIRMARVSSDKGATVPFGAFALAPDGKTLAVAGVDLKVYDAPTGKLRRTVDLGAKGKATVAAFDATGARVAVGMPDAVSVVDVDTGKVVRRVELEGEDDFKRKIYEVALAGDSLVVKRYEATYELLAGDSAPKKLGRFQTVTFAGGRLWAYRAGSTGNFDRKAGKLVDEPGVLVNFDPQTGKELRRVELDAGTFSRTAISGDGSSLALAGFHPVRGMKLTMTDMASGDIMRTIEGRQTAVSSLAVAPDGKQLAVGSQATVALWSMPQAELTHSSPDGRLRAAGRLLYGPKGRQLVVVERDFLIRVRDPASGKLLRAWSQRDVKLAAFRPGTSKLLVAAGHKTQLFEWDLSEIPEPDSSVDADNLRGAFRRPPSGEVIDLPFKILGVDAAELSPDGKWIVVLHGGYVGGKISLVDAASGAKVWTIEQKFNYSRHTLFSADGASLLVSTYREQPVEATSAYVPVLRAYDVRDGRMTKEVAMKTAGQMALRGDALLVSGTHPALLDATTLEHRHTLSVSDQWIRAVVAHPTLDAFFIGGDGGATKLVSANGEVHALFIATPGGDYVATTPDGAYRSSLDGARRLAWSFGAPLEGFSFEQFAASYERPDLVSKRIATLTGEALPPVVRPPRIALKSAPASKTSAARIPLSAHASSSGRVDRVRVFVNGRPVVEEMVCAADADVKLDVPLQPGRNRIALIAYDADGFASNARTLDVESTAKGKRPDLWVITVGVSRYPNLKPGYQLEFADDDARSIAKALNALAGPNKPFARAHVTTLTDAEVTVESTERALGTLSKMKADDLAVVFFAGHGIRFDDGQMRFLTHRASLTKTGAKREGVGWDRMQSVLAAAPGRVLMLLDACHSGHVTTEPVAPNEALAKALAAQNRSGVLVFAASRGSQLSYEVGASSGAGSRGLELAWDGKAPATTRKLATGHGLFTSAMLEALSGKVPDRDRSGAVEMSEMIDFVRERVRAASNGQQTPWVARRELFGDFTLAPASR